MSEAGLNGSERAAVFLMSLSEQEAIDIMKHMPVPEVQRIGQAMATLKKVSREDAESVLTNFADGVESEAPLVGRSPRFLKRLLSSSLGEDKANHMMERLIEDAPRGLDSFQLMEATEITEMIHREHPQVIAILLAGLEPPQASLVLSQLPVMLASDVIGRIAKMDEVPQSAIAELDEVFNKRFTDSGSAKVTQMGGVRAAAEILNAAEKESEKRILDDLTQKDEELSQEIQDNMVVFETLLEIDDRGIQAVVREVTSELLLMALKGADAELQEKIFSNMSKRASELLADDMEAKGPVKLSDVQAAQSEISNVLRRLADEGTVMLSGGGDDFI